MVRNTIGATPLCRIPNKPTDLETEGTQNLTDLSKKVDLSNYLAPSSDIVALMTLEHQTAMTNYLVRLSPAPRNGTRNAPGESLDMLADEVAAYMLFSGDADSGADPGQHHIHKTFAERGPRDSQGRSLRDFDLQNRMFKYPLSYMIYSDAFENMRPPAEDKIYRRIYDVLTAKTPNPKFAHLSAADRQAILEIVRETKANLPKSIGNRVWEVGWAEPDSAFVARPVFRYDRANSTLVTAPLAGA